jgi:hypothetical protein
MNKELEYKDIWSALDQPPTYAEKVAHLVSWSMNYDYKGSPYLVFLDLIGYSRDEYGEPFMKEPDLVLGYLEISMLADALREYSDRPVDVREFIDILNELDRQG